MRDAIIGLMLGLFVGALFLAGIVCIFIFAFDFTLPQAVLGALAVDSMIIVINLVILLWETKNKKYESIDKSENM